MSQIENLSEYGAPPLAEVVVAVQFAAVPEYSTVYSNEVWNLFKSEYPSVQDQPPLQPQFETFGGNRAAGGVQFRVGPQPLATRNWFISKEQNHLLQFQNDRFLLNWRKQKNDDSYPRFSGLIKKYREALEKLSQHLIKEFSYEIDVNQVEVSYINIVPVEAHNEIERWFSFCSSSALNVESLNMAFSEAINSDQGAPIARVHYELKSVHTVDGGEKAFQFSLVFRGKPPTSKIVDALEFIKFGRSIIVDRFGQLTTPSAHKEWDRKK